MSPGFPAGVLLCECQVTIVCEEPQRFVPLSSAPVPEAPEDKASQLEHSPPRPQLALGSDLSASVILHQEHLAECLLCSWLCGTPWGAGRNVAAGSLLGCKMSPVRVLLPGPRTSVCPPRLPSALCICSLSQGPLTREPFLSQASDCFSGRGLL